MRAYPPLAVQVTTPRLELRGATDELLEQLAPVVRAGKAAADPPPYDDPISLYEPDPDKRVDAWLRGVWRGRGAVSQDSWRLSLAVVDRRAVGMQDVVGRRLAAHRAVTTFSWLSSDARGRGLGREMRRAALHLAFEGLGADEADSEAFTDNTGSNGVSRALGYAQNGTAWSTRQGQAALMQRWRLDREAWEHVRGDDVTMHGVAACRATFGLDNHETSPAT